MAAGLVATPYDDLTYQIIGCAMAVHRKLGPGYRENTYQRDLEVSLAEKGLSFKAQAQLEVRDSSQGGLLIGYYIPDFIVEETVIVEIKALRGLDDSHVTGHRLPGGERVPGGVAAQLWHAQPAAATHLPAEGCGRAPHQPTVALRARLIEGALTYVASRQTRPPLRVSANQSVQSAPEIR